MTFEFIFVPDQYVVFVILALFFLIVFFVLYFPLTLSSSLAYLFTHLRRHPLRRRGPPPL
jgi:hypothetical protein